MKATAVRPSRYMSYRRNTYTPYPNSAASRKFAEKLLDAALAAAITAALVVIALFVLLLA